MNKLWGGRFGKVAVVSVLICTALVACTGKKQPTQASFVGKWKSSKLETPLVLYDNGEWEIKKDDGGVLQYGVWEYRDGNIIWSFKTGATIGRDVNAVLAVTDKEFRLQEGRAVTVFRRID